MKSFRYEHFIWHEDVKHFTVVYLCAYSHPPKKKKLKSEERKKKHRPKVINIYEDESRMPEKT